MPERHRSSLLPSWEIRKKDIDREPLYYANAPQFEIVENGPARVAIKVSRELDHSTIEQTVYLESGCEYIRVLNNVDWRSRRTMLKTVFPFSCYNKYASYDLGLGVIKRENNTETLYEVPAQKWADITAGSGKYGVSVFSDCKYGWDKPLQILSDLPAYIHLQARSQKKHVRICRTLAETHSALPYTATRAALRTAHSMRVNVSLNRLQRSRQAQGAREN